MKKFTNEYGTFVTKIGDKMFFKLNGDVKSGKVVDIYISASMVKIKTDDSVLLAELKNCWMEKN